MHHWMPVFHLVSKYFYDMHVHVYIHEYSHACMKARGNVMSIFNLLLSIISISYTGRSIYMA